MNTFTNPNFIRSNSPRAIRKVLGQAGLVSAILDREYPRRAANVGMFSICIEHYNRSVTDTRSGFTIPPGPLVVLHISDYANRLKPGDLARATDSLSLLSEALRAEYGDGGPKIVAGTAHAGLARVAERLGFRHFEPTPGFWTPVAETLVQRDFKRLNDAGMATGAPHVSYMPTSDLHRIYGASGSGPSTKQLADLVKAAREETALLSKQPLK